MQQTPAMGRHVAGPPPLQDASIQTWYDENATRFEEADCIEEAFVDLDAEAQQRLNDFKLRAVAEHVGLDGQDVLEFGAGHGRLALAFPEMARYTGVDYSPRLVDIGNRRLAARSLRHAHLEVGDVLAFQTHRQYDVVCSLGMLAYFPDPRPVISQMFRFVKPGGTVFFDFRCETLPYGAIRRLKWMLNPPTGGRTYLVWPQTIRDCLESLGAKDVRIVSREFPALAELHSRRDWQWPLSLRDRIAESELLRQFATEAWVFARKPD